MTDISKEAVERAAAWLDKGLLVHVEIAAMLRALRSALDAAEARAEKAEDRHAFQKKCQTENVAKIKRQAKALTDANAYMRRVNAELSGAQARLNRIQREGSEGFTERADMAVRIVNQRDEINRLRAVEAVDVEAAVQSERAIWTEAIETYFDATAVEDVERHVSAIRARRG